MRDSIKLMKLAQDREMSAGDLLSAALAGEPCTSKAVIQLYCEIVQNFGRDTESPISRRYWEVCAGFLAGAGFSAEQLGKVRRPWPVYGEPGYKDQHIFDELESSDAIYDELQRQGVIRLPYVSSEVVRLVKQMVAEGRTLTPADIETFQRLPRE